MSAHETIISLVASQYEISFRNLSFHTIEITVSNGVVFSCRNIDLAFNISEKDFIDILNYMKNEVDEMEADYRKRKHYGLYL